MKVNRAALIATAVFASGLGPLANAQTAPAPSTPAADNSAGGVELQEVVVTAERRSEDIQKAPLAIDSLTGADLAINGITDASSITQLVPSAQIGKAAGPFVVFYVRGVGSNASNSLTDAAVSLSLDGVPLARQYDTVGEFYDLARVEVLEGPQGTLYGRNASGGAINIVPNRPTHTTSADFGATIGDYDTYLVNGAVNLPLSDIAAARFSFQSSNHSGYLSDGEADEDLKSGRMQFLFDPSSDLSILLSANLVYQGGIGGGPAISGPFMGHTFDLSDRIGVADPTVVALETGNVPVAKASNLFLRDTFTNFKGEINWKTDIGTLTVIPAYLHNHVDFAAMYGGFETDNEFDSQGSIEARFASNNTGLLTWILGGYYMHDGLSATFTNLTNNAAGTTVQVYDYITDSKAGFADGTLHLTDKFRVIAGIRYTNESKTLDGSNVSTSTPITDVYPAESHTWSAVTYRAGLQYDLTDSSMLYAMVSTGFHSGGFFFTDAQDNGAFNPEKITAYTVGSKNTFLNGRLRANLELYDWQYHDQQLAHPEINASGVQVFATQNAGATSMKGVESNNLFQLARNTQIGLDVQYLDAVFTQYLYDQPAAGSPISKCATGLSGSAVPAMRYFVSCKGLPPPNAPKWIISPSFNQDFPLSSGDVRFDINGHYQTTTFLSVSYQPTDVQKAYFTGNASLTYTAEANKYSVSAYIDNIANSIIGEFASHTNFNAIQLEPPRVVGVRMAAHF